MIIKTFYVGINYILREKVCVSVFIKSSKAFQLFTHCIEKNVARAKCFLVFTDCAIRRLTFSSFGTYLSRCR